MHLVQCGTLGRTPAERRLQKELGQHKKKRKNTGEEKIAKKIGKTPARRRLQKEFQSETVTVSWHPHSQSAKHKETSISYQILRGRSIFYKGRHPDQSHISLDSKLLRSTWQRPPSRGCPGVEERALSRPPSESALAATPRAPAKECCSGSIWVYTLV